VKAIKNGFSAMHLVLDDLLHALKADAAIPRRGSRPSDISTRHCSSSTRSAFARWTGPKRISSSASSPPRYERASIVVTSNKHVRDWLEVFAGDEILTTAILDRLLHHVHIVHIDGRIYRLRELDKLLTPPAAASPPPTPSGGDSPKKAGKPGAWIWLIVHRASLGDP
jgi:hypothetical protein